MADQTEADKLIRELVDVPYDATTNIWIDYPRNDERIYRGSAMVPMRPSFVAPSFNGYIVLNARAIALDAPDKLVKRVVILPFMPQIGMALRLFDGPPAKSSIEYTIRIIELLWDHEEEQFYARCEKIDGQQYERLADAVYWESCK